MIEAIINGLNYRLNEENLTAEVIQKKGYEGDIIIPETVVLKEVSYRVTSIEYGAFNGCFSLTSIVIENGVTSIGESAFRCCPSLTSIVIPDSVTNIGDSAFKDCSSLTSIVIPESVTRIGDRAFDGCSSLTSITFNGTKAQWQGVILGYAWKYKVPAKVVHCTDGDVEI